MTRLSRTICCWIAVALVWLPAGAARCSDLFINEILFNPPGSDSPNEYIELRGTPNLILPNGTYFVAVAGDTNANPGTIKNVFDLSGLAVGANGFLILLQKDNLYTPDTNAQVVVNAGSQGGWGSGSGSSIRHQGDGGITNLIHASATFLLIQTTNSPAPGGDIDPNNTGAPGGAQFAGWTVLDSVGVLGNTGAGDIAYGAINFRRNPNALASGTIVPVSFTPAYVGRSSNTVGWVASDWVAGANLGGSATNSYTLSNNNSNTVPAGFGGAALDNVGSPNFGAAPIPGVLISQSNGSTDVSEAGLTDSYTIALTTPPSGNVIIQITADPQLQVSTNGGVNFGGTGVVALNSTTAKLVTVRAVDDNVVDTSPHPAFLHHQIIATADPSHYPTTSLIPTLRVNIAENDSVLLNELKVNPPGIVDNPFEYIEIKGTPGALLTNVYLLAIEGNAGSDPGSLNLAINLSSIHLGNNGLLVVMATNPPYVVPPATTVVTDPRFNAPGGALGNGTVSFLLVTSPTSFKEGKDLDAGNNGILEGLPVGTTIMDAVGWSDGDLNDVVYGGAVLTASGPPVDAAARFPFNTSPRAASAWFFGELQGTNGATLIFDPSAVSSNFPSGAILSPGRTNDIWISISPLAPLAGAIGDPTNPGLVFNVTDSSPSPIALVVTASSSNPNVVPDSNLIVTGGPGANRLLTINPVGVGYATITITASNAHGIGQIICFYAASAMGPANERFHADASDGSTAIAIDADLMFVGDDETQTIRLYQRNFSGLPVSGFDFQAALEVTDQDRGEVDIEASTRVGNRLFWLGSQSNNNAAQARTNRSRLFATDLAGAGAASTLTFAGRYDHLKEDLISWDVNNLHGKGSNYYGFAASTADGVDPKSPIGFNIEGLTMAPGSTNIAWIGFRAPLVPPSQRAAALVLPVTNFTTLAIGGAAHGAARFGAPIELNLRCRGIRSIEANSNGVLISAGPPGPTTGISPHDYRLFTWSGNPAETPAERSTDLTGLNPEGIVELPPSPWTASSPLQLISDDGTTDWYGDGTEAKHLPFPGFKKFRSDWVTLGDVVVSRPACYTFSVSGGNGTLSWCSVAGLIYRVQWKANLQDATWSDATGNVPATGALTIQTFSLGAGTHRFFRVIIVP